MADTPKKISVVTTRPVKGTVRSAVKPKCRTVDGGLLPEDRITVTGKKNLDHVKSKTNQRVVGAVSNPISSTGGVAGWRGSLAPEGAIVKVAGMKTLQFSDPARRFDREGDIVIDADTNDADTIDVDGGTLDHTLTAAEFEKRRMAWTAPDNSYTTGALRRYAVQLAPAVNGAVTHAGGKVERVCFADI